MQVSFNEMLNNRGLEEIAGYYKNLLQFGVNGKARGTIVLILKLTGSEMLLQHFLLLLFITLTSIHKTNQTHYYNFNSKTLLPLLLRFLIKLQT